MAATVSAWSKPGAWAQDSEENESELLHQHTLDALKPSVSIPEADFPSLADVAKTKSKKKKPQTLSLSEFSTYSAPRRGPEEVLVLPTAPRERTEEELRESRLGGGFRSYDTRRTGLDDSRRRGDRDRDSSSREFGVSRADETDNWGAGKKTMGGFERKGGFGGDSGASRADEVDNWGANKAVGVGFSGDSRRSERRGVGFESNGGADSDNWVKKKEVGGGSFDSLRTRRGSNESVNSADGESWGRKREETNGSVVGARPRLNLQPRTKPLDEGLLQKGGDDVLKVKGANPFGEARPREEVLKEKGQDWKEIDEKLEAVKEKEIKERVNPPDGRKGFGFGNGRGKSPEGRTERAWRKPDAVDPPRSETSENGHAEEPQDVEPPQA